MLPVRLGGCVSLVLPGETGIKSMGTLLFFGPDRSRQTWFLLLSQRWMDCGWRLHPLLSAIDFSDKSKREEQFSCPHKLPCLLMLLLQGLTHIGPFYGNGAIFFSFFFLLLLDRHHLIWESEQSAVSLEKSCDDEVSQLWKHSLFVTLFYYSYFWLFWPSLLDFLHTSVVIMALGFDYELAQEKKRRVRNCIVNWKWVNSNLGSTTSILLSNWWQ